MQKEKIEFTDRYKASGTPYPDVKTVCGGCDGMGYFPLRKNKLNERACKAKGGRLLIVGQKEKKDGGPTKEDDFVFVECPDCCGSRLKEPADELEYGGYKWKRIK